MGGPPRHSGKEEAKMAVGLRPASESIISALNVQPRPDFVETPALQQLAERALSYLNSGFPVHFRGPAGTGKTTLALHVAAKIGRPVIIIAGDEAFTTSDLIGAKNGYQYHKVVDRYIHTVLKYEENAEQRWQDNRLTTACKEGFTLVYDEFSRSRPEANNVLLGILEEHLLILPNMSSEDTYVKVHPNFRAIFTSNPQEYAGVHDTQDALMDRLVTMDLEYYDRDTELGITTARSGLAAEDAGHIVDLVRDFRSSKEYDQTPTLRASIMIARVCAGQHIPPQANDPRFVNICLDVLEAKTAFTSASQERRVSQRKLLMSLIEHYCSSDGHSPQAVLVEESRDEGGDADEQAEQ
jgi:gas vesicle protein GvpN